MDAEVFWTLLGEACRMGRFVATVPNVGASANIVGKLELGEDGGEKVLQKRKRPNSHVHFKPELVSQFAFVYLDPGYGPEPCLEVRADGGQPVLRLYYQGHKPARRYDDFMRACAEHEQYVTGSWGARAQTEAREAAARDAEEEDADETSSAGKVTDEEENSVSADAPEETGAHAV
ncbi:MAG TPA: hypothetical protein VGV38_01730 [Pyrinomonadaceae bacterium]|nr:hypothetical protein [Pyrinomonadaceae bacterium]